MNRESYVDRCFREYGEDFFGKALMDNITSEQVEKGRVFAFKTLADLTAEYGKLGEDVVKELFCGYIFAHFVC